MVEIFGFNREIDGVKYSGQIPATSWDEAQNLLSADCLVDGKLIREIPIEPERDPRKLLLIIPSRHDVH